MTASGSNRAWPTTGALKSSERAEDGPENLAGGGGGDHDLGPERAGRLARVAVEDTHWRDREVSP